MFLPFLGETMNWQKNERPGMYILISQIFYICIKSGINFYVQSTLCYTVPRQGVGQIILSNFTGVMGKF